jgi:hypothetical protein
MGMTASELGSIGRILNVIKKGYAYDPGDSDLDDEQPISVDMTLGDYRTAARLLNVVEEDLYSE